MTYRLKDTTGKFRNTKDHVFEIYVRNAEGETYHLPLREGLKEFLDPSKGYRITINIEGILIVLRNAWDRDTINTLDTMLGDQKSIECMATIKGLTKWENSDSV